MVVLQPPRRYSNWNGKKKNYIGKIRKKLHDLSHAIDSALLPHRKYHLPLNIRCAPAVRDLPERGPDPRSGRIGTGERPPMSPADG